MKELLRVINLNPPDPEFDSVDYKRALEYLETTYPSSVIKLGLERISRLLEMMGRPQDSFPSVIVAGTNGKGSTCAFLESILLEAGLEVGTNLSPHLEQPTERIRVNGQDIPPLEFSKLVMSLAEVVDVNWGDSEKPTYHELMTAAALKYFALEEVQIAILEVGLGGRYDAANAVDARMVVLTPIGLDHTDRLGNDLASIASEKIAVARPGVSVICAPQEPEAMSRIEEEVNSLGAPILLQPSEGPDVYFKEGRFFTDLHIENKGSRSCELGIGGACQGGNAGLAVTTAHALRDSGVPDGIDYIIDEEIISNGLTGARMPGRFETLSRSPMFVLDGAHNPSGAKCLRHTLDIIPGGGWRVIWGMKADKAPEPFIAEIVPHIGSLNICPVPGVESYDVSELAGIATDAGVAGEIIDTAGSPEEALTKVIKVGPEEDGILVTGSLYLVGFVRGWLRKCFDG